MGSTAFAYNKIDWAKMDVIMMDMSLKGDEGSLQKQVYINKNLLSDFKGA